MSSLKKSFEKELKNKLSLKASGHTTDETVLLKAFKYFDLDNSGMCSKNEFIKAINKIGITGFTEEDLEEIFVSYDVDENGELSYKEFVGVLYHNNSIINEKRQNPIKGEPSPKKEQQQESKEEEEIMNILQRVREKLAARGVRGICSIARNFAVADDNNSNTIDFKEFKKACKDFRFGLSENELRMIYGAFDRDNSGEIDYDEFLRMVRGDMNDFRRNIVKKIFDKLDSDKSGIIDKQEIKDIYNAERHPDVLSGKRNEDEIIMEFMETFEQTYSYLNGNQTNGKITLDEFMEYYENVSMSIDDDAYFETLLNNCWGMGDNTTYNNSKKGWSNKDNQPTNTVKDNYNKAFPKKAASAHPMQKLRSAGKKKKGQVEPEEEEQPQPEDNEEQETKSNVPRLSKNKIQAAQDEEDEEDYLIQKLRQKLIQRGGNGIIGLARQFKIFDDNNSKTLEKNEFIKAMTEFKVGLTNKEIDRLFDLVDLDGSGELDYNEFLRTVRGPMNEARKKVVLLAFNKMDIDNSGVIEMSDVKQFYSAKGHKDVVSGEKSEEEIYEQFLQTFETFHNFKKGIRDKKVTKEEFLEYYNNISMSIDNDQYFIEMIEAAWKLNKQPIIRKAWATDLQEPPVRAGRKIGEKMQKVGTPNNAPFGTSNEPINYITSNNPDGLVGVSFSTKGEPVLLKFREKVASRGARGIMSIRRAFMIADDNNSNTIELDEFIKFCEDYRIGLTNEEEKKLFKIFDKDNSGAIDYNEFLRTIVGEMNEFRTNIVKKVFEKLDKNRNGEIEIEDIKGAYSTKNHPDIEKGRKSEDEVLAEFLDTFEYHFGLLNSNQTKDSRITLEEFIEYYNNISMSIDDDLYFEVILTNAWNLDDKPNYGKGWAADSNKNFNFGKGGWKKELVDKKKSVLDD